MRHLKSLLMAAMATLLVAGTAQADMRKVVIGTEGAYPPFNWIDANGELQGFDVDIAKALCKAAEFECTFVVQDWDGMIPGLIAKKYDAIIASMSITDERKEKVDFTGKYYNSGGKFACAKGCQVEFTAEGMKGKVVGVQRATIHENFVRDNFPDADLRVYATQDEANADLAAGRLDLVLADAVALEEGFIKTEQGACCEMTGPVFADPKWFGEGAGIAIRKGEEDLVAAFNKAIETIRADGTYKAINDKYFAFDIYGEAGS